MRQIDTVFNGLTDKAAKKAIEIAGNRIAIAEEFIDHRVLRGFTEKIRAKFGIVA